MRRLSVLIFFLICLGCEPGPRVSEFTPGEPARYTTLLASGRIQEAAWEARKLGRGAEADSLLEALAAVLVGDPIDILAWTGPSISEAWVLTFEGGTRGLFKVQGSDPDGSILAEIAAYQIDRLLEFDLTPLTLVRPVTLPKERTVHGSIQYFVPDADTAVDLDLKSTDKPDRLLLFDAVIGNADRHLRNWLIRRDTREVIAIDHNRAFNHSDAWTWYQRVRAIQDPVKLVQHLRRLSRASDAQLRDAAESIDPERVSRLLEARASILRFFKANGVDLAN